MILAWTTVSDSETATELARQAVEKQLAACVQVNGPVTSFYSWKGKVESDQEWRLLLKTTDSRLEQLKSWLLAAHPYDNPEWVSVEANGVSSAYMEWANTYLQ